MNAVVLNRQEFLPETEAGWHALRAQDITSTDAPALFNLSPYQTAFELWHAKRDQVVATIDPNDRMLWGTRLQDAIAAGIAEDQGLVVRPMREYMRILGVGIGSSFDFAIEAALESSPFYATWREHGPGILEIKNVDFLAFRNGWTVEDDFVEAPPHIEIQVQHQQLAAGRNWSLLGALIGGNRYELIERRADLAVHAGIVNKARDFWQSIRDGIAPDPVMPDDAEAVIRMHQFAEPGKLLDARDKPAVAAMIAEYAATRRQLADLEEQSKVRKAELLQAIGDAEKVLVDGFSVSAGLVGPSAGTLVTPDMVGQTIGGRSGYRLLRVTAKKGKA